MPLVPRIGPLALATVVAVAACRDPLTPSELDGHTFALTRAGARGLPVVLQAERGDTTSLLADSITFGPSPRATRVIVHRYHFAGEAPRTETLRLDVEFRVSGRRVEVGWFKPCGPTASCAANLVGRLLDVELVVESGNPIADGGAWRYVVVR